MKAIQQLLILSMLYTLLGCAARGEKFQTIVEPQSGNAAIYLFRKEAFAGSAYCPNVNVNGNYFGCLKMRGYFRIEVPAGKNEICFCKSAMEIGDDVELKLSLSEGEIRFIEWIPHGGNIAIVGNMVVPTGGKMESVIERTREESILILSSLKLSD